MMFDLATECAFPKAHLFTSWLEKSYTDNLSANRTCRVNYVGDEIILCAVKRQLRASADSILHRHAVERFCFRL